MKIERIEVKNFKAIKAEVVKFNGCSAIITAGNDKGKTSLLRGLIDRFRGEKPDLIVSDGEAKGFNMIELTDGSRIEWKFTEKTESFAYITKDGIKKTTGVLSAIGERYFGIKFDIDKFLNSGKKEQTKELQRIVGIDFTDINERYKVAFGNRTDANKELKRLTDNPVTKPTKIEKPNIENLKQKLSEAKKSNKELMSEWEKKNKEHVRGILDFNKKQEVSRSEYNISTNCMVTLSDLGFADSNQVLKDFIETLKPKKSKELSDLQKPKLKGITGLEEQIEKANESLRIYDAFERDLESYNNWVKEGTTARETQKKTNEIVESIEKEKKDLISNAKIPKDFEINEDGILYKGLPLTDNQISSSGKYIAALKLGAMVLGEIKTMHFDASFLDNNSLSEIQNWADENNLQLLIERPDVNGGDIKYEIIK